MAVMCCATARPLPLSHHRRSRTVDSYFHQHFDFGSDAGGDNNGPLATTTISLGLSKVPPMRPRAAIARPAHICDTRRSTSVDFHANVLSGGHRRSKSYRISSSTLASLSSGASTKASSKPKAARKAKKGVKFGQVHARGFNLIVSEHPSVTSGLGIEFGWDFCTLSSRTVDECEQNLGNETGETKRCNDELLLTRKMRNRKLAKYGDYSEREIFLEERKREMAERADFFRPVESFDM